jgi:hypothetical protein
VQLYRTRFTGHFGHHSRYQTFLDSGLTPCLPFNSRQWTHRAGNQGRHRGGQRRRSADHHPADGLLRHQDSGEEGSGQSAAWAKKETSLSPWWVPRPSTSARSLASCRFFKTPVCRFCAALKILEHNNKPGKLKNALMDTCDEIETGSTLSEAMSKSPQSLQPLVRQYDQSG